ncbi:MAG: BatD family protein [Opitutae bacterium]|nr:BatD family protein [Opitutae bacterium]
MHLFGKFLGKALGRAFPVALFLCIATTLFAAQERLLEVSISPNPIVQNSMANISIETSGVGKIRSVEFPQIDGITWHENVRGSSTSIINGDVKTSTSFGFVVTKPGEIEIPSFKVVTDRGEYFTRPLRFAAGKATSGIYGVDGREVELSEAVFMRVERGDNSRKFYFVGEEIPVTVYVLANPRVSASLASVPQISDESAFSVSDADEAQKGQATLEGATYNALIFRKNLLAIKPGTFDVEFSCDANCVLPTSGNRASAFPSAFPDSFFGARSAFAQRGTTVALPLKDALGGVEVRPRPPLPDNALDLGIVSAGEIFCEFSDGKKSFPLDDSAAAVKQGAPLYLDLFVDCASDSIVAPEISLPGFRAYPPEVSTISESTWAEKSRSRPTASASVSAAKNLRQIRWMLIPLSAGKLEADLKFARLNPAAGDYEIFEVKKKFECEEDKTLATTAGATEVFAGKPAATNDSPPQTAGVVAAKNLADNILYNRSLSAATIADGKNRPHGGAFALALGAAISVVALAFAGLVELRCRRRSRMESDPTLSRRARASSRKREILKKLAATNAENFDELVRTEVADYIADATGASSADAAKKSLKNPELAEIFASAELAGYSPVARGTRFEKSRKILIDAIRRSAFVILLVGIVALAFPKNLRASDNDNNPPPARDNEIVVAQDAYAAGDFARACEGFSALAEESPFSADVWFNLGNAFFQNREYARALVCYERSRRLDISRSDTLSNMNAACRKLGVPVRGEVKTPLDVLALVRDCCGATTWAVVAGIGVWLGVLIFLSGRLSRRRSREIFGIVVAVVVASFCAANAAWQRHVLFDNNAAIVVATNAELRNLPVENSSQKIATIAAGTTVEILETRERASLVKVELDNGTSTEGWLDNTTFATILSTSPLH